MGDNIGNMEAEYQVRRPQYVAFTESLVDLLRKLIKSQGIEYIEISGRTKDNDKFSKKIQRPSKINKYKQIADVTDLSGVRIVTLYQKDVDEVCKIIEKYLKIDRKNSVDKTKASDPDRFGYASVHYVVSYDAGRSKMPENKLMNGLKAEIQVRTVLQHAWAVMDRELRYDDDSAIPVPIKRKLFRVSAMLEGADENLMEIYKQVADLRLGYAKDVKTGNLQVLINKDSLEVFLEESATVKGIIAAATAAKIRSLRYHGEISDDDIKYNRVLPLLKAAKVETIGQLDGVLNNTIASHEEIFKAFIKGSDFKGVFSIFALIRILFYFSSDKAIHRLAIRSGGFIGTTRMRIDKAYSELVR